MNRFIIITFIVLATSPFALLAQKMKQSSFKDNGKSYSNDSTQKELYNKVTPSPIVKPARDFLMLAFTYNNWIKPDTVKTKTFNYGFNSYFCYDFPIKKSNFSFAAGIGINVSVTYLDQQQLIINDTGSIYGAQARFIPDTQHFTRYKFVTAYLQSPFEIRYFSNNLNRNKGFKAAVGLQIGTLLGAHTKGVMSVGGTPVKEKLDTRRYVTPWNFATTLRIGWGNFSVYGSYNLTTVFKENNGPVITPYSIGFCLTGL